MTIKEKAEQSGLEIDKVVELCKAVEIDASDPDRKLEKVEAMTLGKVVNKYLEAKGTGKAVKTVRFWTLATKHLVQAGNERIEFKDNVLVLDAESDIETIALVRSLKNIAGRYAIYEVLDQPYEDESDDAVAFSKMLEDIVFTGHNREHSKAGMKTVCALFSSDELAAMGANRSDPRRLVLKALRSKSLKLVSN